MNRLLKNQYITAVIRCFYTQLFISLVSFPILVCWGIPISPLSLVSTPVFAPILALFLLLSSTIFICILVGMPYQFPLWLLDTVASFWTICLEWQHQIPAIGFAQPHWFIMLICPAFAICTAQSKKSIGRKTVLLCFFSAALIFFLKSWKQFVDQKIVIPYQKKAVHLMHEKGVITVFDPGAIGSRPSACSWICFEMIPTIIKKTGATQIDNLILSRINQRTFQAVTAALLKIDIKNIYLPRFQGTLTKKCWRSYFILCETAQATGCTVHKITPKNEPVHLSGTDCFVQSKKRPLSYQNASFQELEITKK